MVVRKIWVKRPLASATLVPVTEDDLVDDVRDQILRKYTNSLGRQFDAPDIVVRLCSRDPQQSSRALQPDEPILRLIDGAYPGGQTVEEALLIDIPSRRTPKASPNPRFFNDDRPHESGTDYFPPYTTGPPLHHSSTHLQAGTASGPNGLHFPPSIGIVNGNALPPLPSPGSVRRLAARPKMVRGHTASPIAHIPANGTSSHPPQSGASADHPAHTAQPAAIPSPPAPEPTATPPARVASPRPSARARKVKKPEKPTMQLSFQSQSGLVNGGVPPINVLIVEDNIINLKLLEAFVKRLKVRWQTAMNGRDAVTKWRTGGFHLVLMDIQLPIMNGLDATREIRRLEKVNSIGVFSTSASSAPGENHDEPDASDKLSNTEMFKSPVIIVALTASSLQSDRHEALAAGCNDFLTKPVNFVWLERKVMEWGCMQALIDFDGWRKWKDFSQKAQEAEAAKKAATAKAKARKEKGRLPTPVAA
ncbi:hypothetical protein Micbo1qcDRAFT_164149 [Microdochium bolleyi]|uniref:Response regulatory domain-containing protein n=1 Tax=Microdochium bolleyi TaxID=196109 RepID=A0A136J0B6_9PEZI|nr:hypothetical protein Micbo1qcDRAFT_164149 [Microdochium bolleyi]